MSQGQRFATGSGARTALDAILREQGRRFVWVAARLGVDASTVSRWCSGDRPIPSRRIEELAAVLGVEVADLTATGSDEVVRP